MKDQKVLFIGDTLVFAGITRYDLSNSNIADLYESIERIRNFKIPGETELFFGHGERLSFNKMINTYPCFTNPLQLSVKTKGGVVIPVANPYFDGQAIRLPLRLIAEAAGAKVDWDSANKAAIVSLPKGKVIKAQIGNEMFLLIIRLLRLKQLLVFMMGKLMYQVSLLQKNFVMT